MAFRIGDVASVVNPYKEYSDVGEALMSAVQNKGLVPYNKITQSPQSYLTVDDLIQDLFIDPNKQVVLLIDITQGTDALELAAPLLQKGAFVVKEYNSNYLQLVPNL
jgi:hypothetical protein